MFHLVCNYTDDTPVQDNEPGRLILTSLQRMGQQIKRYEIGDLGRWVLGHCPCGRKSTMFEILGRHGDVFRVGSRPLLNYKRLATLLQERMNYGGNLQLEIQGKEGLVLYISKECGLEPEEVRETIISHYDDLKDCITNYGNLQFLVKAIDENRFKVSQHSGKLIHIIGQA